MSTREVSSGLRVNLVGGGGREGGGRGERESGYSINLFIKSVRDILDINHIL